MAGSSSREGSSSVSSPVEVATSPEPASADEDIWASDHEDNPGTSSHGQPQAEDLLSDLPTVKRQHMTDGYREGLGVGKAKVMQKGFDDGYPIGVMIALRVGKVLGCIEGVLAAKDIPDTRRSDVRRTYERAKSELAINSLLKGIDDQNLMASKTFPASIETALEKWETVTFGTAVGSEGNARVPS